MTARLSFLLAPRLTTFLRGNAQRSKCDLRLRAFRFFRLPFFSFSYLFAAVIDPLPDLLPVRKTLRKHHREGQILPWSSHGVVAGNFAPSSSLKFLSIFVDISGSTGPISLLRVSLERSFPPAELEYRGSQFGSS